ncbi:MAG: hypothetical protein LBM13_02325, partial [Candidatus Ancillula sp.]|nr:hypothetical protein [Candidatus Ancillula sp.]
MGKLSMLNASKRTKITIVTVLSILLIGVGVAVAAIIHNSMQSNAYTQGGQAHLNTAILQSLDDQPGTILKCHTYTNSGDAADLNDTEDDISTPAQVTNSDTCSGGDTMQATGLQLSTSAYSNISVTVASEKSASMATGKYGEARGIRENCASGLGYDETNKTAVSGYSTSNCTNKSESGLFAESGIGYTPSTYAYQTQGRPMQNAYNAGYSNSANGNINLSQYDNSKADGSGTSSVTYSSSNQNGGLYCNNQMDNNINNNGDYVGGDDCLYGANTYYIQNYLPCNATTFATWNVADESQDNPSAYKYANDNRAYCHQVSNSSKAGRAYEPLVNRDTSDAGGDNLNGWQDPTQAPAAGQNGNQASTWQFRSSSYMKFMQKSSAAAVIYPQFSDGNGNWGAIESNVNWTSTQGAHALKYCPQSAKYSYNGDQTGNPSTSNSNGIFGAATCKDNSGNDAWTNDSITAEYDNVGTFTYMENGNPMRAGVGARLTLTNIIYGRGDRGWGQGQYRPMISFSNNLYSGINYHNITSFDIKIEYYAMYDKADMTSDVTDPTSAQANSGKKLSFIDGSSYMSFYSLNANNTNMTGGTETVAHNTADPVSNNSNSHTGDVVYAFRDSSTGGGGSVLGGCTSAAINCSALTYHENGASGSTAGTLAFALSKNAYYANDATDNGQGGGSDAWFDDSITASSFIRSGAQFTLSGAENYFNVASTRGHTWQSFSSTSLIPIYQNNPTETVSSIIPLTGRDADENDISTTGIGGSIQGKTIEATDYGIRYETYPDSVWSVTDTTAKGNPTEGWNGATSGKYANLGSEFSARNIPGYDMRMNNDLDRLWALYPTILGTQGYNAGVCGSSKDSYCGNSGSANNANMTPIVLGQAEAQSASGDYSVTPASADDQTYKTLRAYPSTVNYKTPSTKNYLTNENTFDYINYDRVATYRNSSDEVSVAIQNARQESAMLFDIRKSPVQNWLRSSRGTFTYTTHTPGALAWQGTAQDASDKGTVHTTDDANANIIWPDAARRYVGPGQETDLYPGYTREGSLDSSGNVINQDACDRLNSIDNNSGCVPSTAYDSTNDPNAVYYYVNQRMNNLSTETNILPNRIDMTDILPKGITLDTRDYNGCKDNTSTSNLQPSASDSCITTTGSDQTKAPIVLWDNEGNAVGVYAPGASESGTMHNFTKVDESQIASQCQGSNTQDCISFTDLYFDADGNQVSSKSDPNYAYTRIQIHISLNSNVLTGVHNGTVVFPTDSNKAAIPQEFSFRIRAKFTEGYMQSCVNKNSGADGECLEVDDQAQVTYDYSKQFPKDGYTFDGVSNRVRIANGAAVATIPSYNPFEVEFTKEDVSGNKLQNAGFELLPAQGTTNGSVQNNLSLANGYNLLTDDAYSEDYYNAIAWNPENYPEVSSGTDGKIHFEYKMVGTYQNDKGETVNAYNYEHGHTYVLKESVAPQNMNPDKDVYLLQILEDNCSNNTTTTTQIGCVRVYKLDYNDETQSYNTANNYVEITPAQEAGVGVVSSINMVDLDSAMPNNFPWVNYPYVHLKLSKVNAVSVENGPDYVGGAVFTLASRPKGSTSSDAWSDIPCTDSTIGIQACQENPVSETTKYEWSAKNADQFNIEITNYKFDPNLEYKFTEITQPQGFNEGYSTNPSWVVSWDLANGVYTPSMSWNSVDGNTYTSAVIIPVDGSNIDDICSANPAQTGIATVGSKSYTCADYFDGDVAFWDPTTLTFYYYVPNYPNMNHTLQFQKVSDQGGLLDGFSFSLVKSDENARAYKGDGSLVTSEAQLTGACNVADSKTFSNTCDVLTATSGSDGLVKFNNLESGYFLLRETGVNPSLGYTKSSYVWLVKTTGDYQYDMQNLQYNAVATTSFAQIASGINWDGTNPPAANLTWQDGAAASNFCTVNGDSEDCINQGPAIVNYESFRINPIKSGDIEGNTVVPLAGAKFSLYECDGSVSQTSPDANGSTYSIVDSEQEAKSFCNNNPSARTKINSYTSGADGYLVDANGNQLSAQELDTTHLYILAEDKTTFNHKSEGLFYLVTFYKAHSCDPTSGNCDNIEYPIVYKYTGVTFNQTDTISGTGVTLGQKGSNPIDGFDWNAGTDTASLMVDWEMYNTPIKTRFAFEKGDDFDTALPGASFAIAPLTTANPSFDSLTYDNITTGTILQTAVSQSDSTCSDWIAELTHLTDCTGWVNFDVGLDDGWYVVWETDAPNGYSPAEHKYVYHFGTKYNSTTQNLDDDTQERTYSPNAVLDILNATRTNFGDFLATAGGYGPGWTTVNDRKFNIDPIKTDLDLSTPLAGAKFTLYQCMASNNGSSTSFSIMENSNNPAAGIESPYTCNTNYPGSLSSLGNYVSDSTGHLVTDDANKTPIIQQNLSPLYVYRLIETSAPQGYTLTGGTGDYLIYYNLNLGSNGPVYYTDPQYDHLVIQSISSQNTANTLGCYLMNPDNQSNTNNCNHQATWTDATASAFAFASGAIDNTPFNSDIAFIKYDSFAEPLNGAVFSLDKTDASGVSLSQDGFPETTTSGQALEGCPGSGSSSIAGLVSFCNLTTGYYLLTETSAPTGYSTTGNQYLIYVTSKNESTNDYPTISEKKGGQGAWGTAQTITPRETLNGQYVVALNEIPLANDLGTNLGSTHAGLANRWFYVDFENALSFNFDADKFAEDATTRLSGAEFTLEATCPTSTFAGIRPCAESGVTTPATEYYISGDGANGRTLGKLYLDSDHDNYLDASETQGIKDSQRDARFIYKLTETKAPQGFDLPSDKVWYIGLGENTLTATSFDLNPINASHVLFLHGATTSIGEILTGQLNIVDMVKPVTITFTKYDENNNTLDGATFSLDAVDSTGVSLGKSNYPKSNDSTNGGQVTFEELEDGYYLLSETNTVTGYQKSDNQYIIHISISGSSQVVEVAPYNSGVIGAYQEITGIDYTTNPIVIDINKAISYINTYLYYNIAPSKIDDSSSEKLDGAKFYFCDSSNLASRANTNEGVIPDCGGDAGNGYTSGLTFVSQAGVLLTDKGYTNTSTNQSILANENINSISLDPEATYQLVEYQAPTGYILPTGAASRTWTISFSRTTGQVIVVRDGNIAVTTTKTDVTGTYGIFAFDIPNQKSLSKFTFTKVDQRGIGLDGADFAVEGGAWIDGSGFVNSKQPAPAQTLTSANGGKVSLDNLADADYRICETGTVANYIFDSN